MPLTPYQNDIWLKMTAKYLNCLAALGFGVAIFAMFGFRFMDHQIKIGLVAGVVLFWIGWWILRYLSPLDASDG